MKPAFDDPVMATPVGPALIVFTITDSAIVKNLQTEETFFLIKQQKTDAHQLNNKNNDKDTK